jgi:hypothetical protein
LFVALCLPLDLHEDSTRGSHTASHLGSNAATMLLLSLAQCQRPTANHRRA